MLTGAELWTIVLISELHWVEVMMVMEVVMSIEQLLRVGQVAEVLQVHPQTVYGLIRNGKIRAAKVGRAWRIKPEAIDDYLKDQMQANEKSDRTWSQE